MCGGGVSTSTTPDLSRAPCPGEEAVKEAAVAGWRVTAVAAARGWRGAGMPPGGGRMLAWWPCGRPPLLTPCPAATSRSMLGPRASARSWRCGSPGSGPSGAAVTAETRRAGRRLTGRSGLPVCALSNFTTRATRLLPWPGSRSHRPERGRRQPPGSGRRPPPGTTITLKKRLTEGGRGRWSPRRGAHPLSLCPRAVALTIALAATAKGAAPSLPPPSGAPLPLQTT